MNAIDISRYLDDKTKKAYSPELHSLTGCAMGEEENEDELSHPRNSLVNVVRQIEVDVMPHVRDVQTACHNL